MAEALGRQTLDNLKKFIAVSPTAFHAVANMRQMLVEAGFTELDEKEFWKLEDGGKYFCSRNDSSLIAFVLPEGGYDGFNIIAAHTDSPSFKVKDAPVRDDYGYVRLNVEEYGGALHHTWMDRPLSIAGRVFVRDDGAGAIRGMLVDFEEPIALFPSLAIHMDREVNGGRKLDAVSELCPVIGLSDGEGDVLAEKLSEQAGCRSEDIVAHDLFCYPVPLPVARGLDCKLFASSRLDDLACAYPAFEGFLESVENGCRSRRAAVYAAFDNEEVGSRTKQGADSTFLESVLTRITGGGEKLLVLLANSFMLSADNAHAIHPGNPAKCDIGNQPRLNGGIVLKHAANQSYCTDGKSAAVVKMLASSAGVPVQVFTNRSGQPGGSTLGNILLSHVSVDGADIGLAQLAMHSTYEMMGSEDPGHLARFAKTFFESDWQKI